MKRDFKRRLVSIAGIDPVRLLGIEDRNLRFIEEHFDERIAVRGDEIAITGPARRVEQLTRVFERLIEVAGGGRPVTEADVLAAIGGDGKREEAASRDEPASVFYSPARRRAVAARSARQQDYIDAIRSHDIVFAIGPAGTGKTYLAIAAALASLRSGAVTRIFISRPVVEAGENLGYLPGDLQEKLEPYLRPIFDALRDMLGNDRIARMIGSGVIEIAPLAYMRGRTLENAFAILDEAQNCSIGQMKMFLTRLGEGAKAIVTGDITQIDLDDPSRSGLVAAREILAGIEGIAFVAFSDEDVVRHRLVRRIINAWSARAGRFDPADASDRPGPPRGDGCAPPPDGSHD